jgi:oxygen-independent coproporphyrinogen-3 oxidase
VARREAVRGLYVHVPFCARRCHYCDFATGVISSGAVERYLIAIEHEAERRSVSARHAVFTSVFFGGGTPSMLGPRHFARLMQAVRGHFAIAPDAEITLEANPESVRPVLLDAWRQGGVNRLSMGAQSFDADELVRLGRIHGPERPAEALALARAHGFRRLSLDLMFGFPGHEPERWSATLDTALALEPEHLSAYCFIPEGDTPLGAAVLGGRETPVDADRQADLYEALLERTVRAGFACYETSNFARPGGECRHNLVYWLRREYLALGPSAHGLWRGERYANHRDLGAWADALERDTPCATSETETEISRSDEIVMLGLRLGTGVRRADHAPETWRALMARYGLALATAARTGRLIVAAGGFRIAARHRFVADDVIAWLMAAADGDAAQRAAAPSGRDSARDTISALGS